jgi:tRNA (Thr-GGU) A37 N-methylase
LHPVIVRAIEGTRLKIGPIEAFDGTPVVDIKSAPTDDRRGTLTFSQMNPKLWI